ARGEDQLGHRAGIGAVTRTPGTAGTRRRLVRGGRHEAGQRGPVVATVLFAVAVAVASAAAVADAVADDDMAGVRSGRLPGAGDQGPVVGAAGAVDSGATADPADPGDAGGEDDPGPGGGEHVG